MSEIKVQKGESLDSALRRFKRSCQKAGVLSEVRKREHYEKPSVRRKLKSEAKTSQKTPILEVTLELPEQLAKQVELVRADLIEAAKVTGEFTVNASDSCESATVVSSTLGQAPAKQAPAKQPPAKQAPTWAEILFPDADRNRQ